MTPQQLIAFAHPCRLGEETVHPRFAVKFNETASVILTINSGYE